MKSQLVRLALLQVTVILYMVLSTAVLLKFCGLPPAAVFARCVRDYGVALFLVPIAWCLFTMLIENNPAHSLHGSMNLMLMGWGIAAALVIVAVMANFSVMLHSTPLVQAQPDKSSRVGKWMPPDNQ